MQSEMTSRLTRLYFMPSVPMAMPSEIVGVPNNCALAPQAGRQVNWGFPTPYEPRHD